MKFSSDDIIKQEFERRVRGYDVNQVREFLEGVAREWDHLAMNAKQAQKERDELMAEVREYRRRERTLQDALDMARQMSEDLKHQATREAELLVADAEIKAEKILAECEDEISRAQSEVRVLEERRVRVLAELKATLETHLAFVEKFETSEVEWDAIEEETNLAT
ncbi:DivIVA domain-containing protein [Microvenator marinus]|jgi:cell division initiation protein|uniref:DivIVA domain-containing protein n=1 Tax=Microvenator marinus TaxID=2600177 RepID=A0A5B8XMI1_9DELT|nr:DivIVA domain-containing protein [Microvenator marinus]QED26198.1 DivIVA domain-containing protein [Microvenator marinus]